MDEEQPRAYTEEEVRDMLLSHIRTMVDYWVNLPHSPAGKLGPQQELTIRDRVEGVAFSILVALDGAAMGFPAAVTLKMEPHPDDKEDAQANGENWIEPGMEIADSLHDHFFKRA